MRPTVWRSGEHLHQQGLFRRCEQNSISHLSLTQYRLFDTRLFWAAEVLRACARCTLGQAWLEFALLRHC